MFDVRLYDVGFDIIEKASCVMQEAFSIMYATIFYLEQFKVEGAEIL